MRFHSYHQKIRELIADGKLGQIVSARAQLTCWYPEIENCRRQDKSLSGGGAMMDMGIHCIDLIRYITGLEPVEAAAMCGNQIFRYNADDAGGYDAQQTCGEIKPLELEVEFGNMYTKEVEAFADAVLNGGKIPVTAADAIRSQRAIEAAYAGSDAGKTVAL